jgi:hypothetical protein
VTIKFRYSLIIFVALLLTACGITSLAAETPTAAAPSATETLTPLPTFTQVAFPPIGVFSTAAALPTRTPVPASLPKFPLDGYVMLFTKDSNLYFQDGDSSPVKLAYIGKESYDPKFSDDTQWVYFSPILSDDNQKVVFSQSDGNTYSINTDGTQERMIVSIGWLESFKAGTKIGILNFIPNTHQLLLETHLRRSQTDDPSCSSSIFLADSDTGKIGRLADFGLHCQTYGIISKDIKISPDGKMLAVGTLDGVDIFTMDGNLIRDNVLPYIASTAYTFFPSLFWLADSSGLIVALPDTIYNTQAHGDLAAHTIWRYTIASNAAVQIPLEPPPWMDTFVVSPDGNWIAYGGYSDPSLYLGNLVNGHMQIFGNNSQQPSFSWSPDSKHLIAGWTVLTSFDRPPVVVGSGSEWIDSNHFTYYDLPANNPTIQQERVLIAEIRGDEIFLYDLGLPYLSLRAIKPKR